MATLTEEEIINCSTVRRLSEVKILTWWGPGLTDVSVLRRMRNIQVLSLCLNKITSLSDFQFCYKLRELSVHKNNIKDLNQILYLQNLPQLKSLWLDENPCAKTEGYRLTVLRALPNLKKLDNIAVQPNEVQDAMRRGQILVHPENIRVLSPGGELQWASGFNSPFYNPTQHERSPPRQQGTGDREPEAAHVQRHSALMHDEHHTHYEADSRSSNYGAEPPVSSQHHSCPYERSLTSNSHPGEASQLERVQDEIGTSMAMSNSMPLMKSSNILSAVLCLIKELDYATLTVVEVAVRSRLTEL